MDLGNGGKNAHVVGVQLAKKAITVAANAATAARPVRIMMILFVLDSF